MADRVESRGGAEPDKLGKGRRRGVQIEGDDNSKREVQRKLDTLDNRRQRRIMLGR